MAQELYLQQWCTYRQISFTQLSDQTGIESQQIESIQNGKNDPSLSLMKTLAAQLQIPTSWLHYDPQVIQRVWNDADDDEPELPNDHAMDPVFERMIQIRRDHPEIFVLLTKLVHHGDPKLIRAAQVTLQSLSKQIRETTVPWGSRPSGHFEPPSD